MKIQDIKAREIFDSRGNPTVECEMIIEGIGYSFRGLVPSGASTVSLRHSSLEMVTRTE